jgi:hypothetical protein
MFPDDDNPDRIDETWPTCQMRYDAKSNEAEAEMAAWREILDNAKTNRVNRISK